MKAIIDKDGSIVGLFPNPETIPILLLEKYRLVEVEICPLCNGSRYIETPEAERRRQFESECG